MGLSDPTLRMALHMAIPHASAPRTRGQGPGVRPQGVGLQWSLATFGATGFGGGGR